MVKRILLLLTALLTVAALLLPCAGESVSPTYRFVLQIDGVESREVDTGDTVEVRLTVKRTDAEAPYEMYAMQDEIAYDGSCFTLVENSVSTAPGVVWKDIAQVDGTRRFYLNFLSVSGGEIWNAETVVGTFRLKVTGQSGVSRITNENAMVSKKDGSGSFEITASPAKAILSTECTVRFNTRGGNAIDNIQVEYGEFISPPETPVRPGFRFCGWYRDIDLTSEWDFDTDTVPGNITLYAKWEKAADENAAATVAPTSGAPMMLSAVVIVLVLSALAVWWFALRKKRKE